MQCGAILLSGNALIIKITLWGLSTPQNAPFLGAIYPQKRCTFANVVGSYAINVPPTCLQSRPTHPVKSAFYTIQLRFSWDIGIYSATTPLTAEREPQIVDKQTLAALFVFQKLHHNCTIFCFKSSKIFNIEDIPSEFAFKSLNLDYIEDLIDYSRHDRHKADAAAQPKGLLHLLVLSPANRYINVLNIV